MSASTPKINLTRLPYEIREELCIRIRDRNSWKQLNDWLSTNGFGPYKPQNFSAFKQAKGHYQEWLKEQAKLDERRSRSESIRREIQAEGFDMVDRTMLDLVEKLSDPTLDPIKAASVLASLKQAVVRAQGMELDKQRLKIAEGTASLDREKFRFEVANKFLDWFADDRARNIAESGTDRSAQVKQLLALMDEMEK